MFFVAVMPCPPPWKGLGKDPHCPGSPCAHSILSIKNWGRELSQEERWEGVPQNVEIL